MNPMIRSLLCGSLLLLLIAFPAAASPVLVSDVFTPNPPLVPGGQQQIVATYAIPSGTTFPKDHELQLQTQLTDAKWNIQVILDGNNAARQSASGSAAFINGMILSYPVSHDVSFTVTITGKVPSSGTGSEVMLDLVEIDNSNNIVPGSQITISQPVTGTNGTSPVATVPAHTPPLVASTPPATKTPGFPAPLGIFAGSLAGLVWIRRRHLTVI